MSNVLDFGVNGANPSKVGGTGTSVKYFPRPLPGWGNIGNGGPGNALPTTPSSSNATGALFLPAQNVFNGQQFNIIVAGSYGNDSGDPSGTVTVNLYAVTGTLTSPTYTAIGGTGAATPTHAGPESFFLDFVVEGDTNSGVLSGYYTGVVNGAFKNTAGTTNTVILANNISGLDFSKGNTALQQGAVLGFVVGATFGTSDATNTSSLFEFAIES
jgi:hypothetical protein